MSIAETIEAATKAVGSQKALAQLLGIPETHISGFKKGRPCSYQKHAQIAAAAGMREEAVQILIEGMASGLSDDVEHEALIKNGLDQVRAGVLAMLNAFPPESDATTEQDEMKVHSRSHLLRRLLVQVLAQHRVTPGVFFARCFVRDPPDDDQRHIKMPRRRALAPAISKHAQPLGFLGFV